MVMSLRCRICGRVITGRYPIYLLTWLLSIISVILILIIPTIVGFGSTSGGVAVIIGIFIGLVVLYIFVRAPNTCQACRVSSEKEKGS